MMSAANLLDALRHKIYVNTQFQRFVHIWFVTKRYVVKSGYRYTPHKIQEFYAAYCLATIW